eukprot:1757266-Amphidinium_carterae.1
MAVRAILESDCDIVLLQECDASFLDDKYNWMAWYLWEKYDCVHSVQPSQTNVYEGGTAVLIKKDGVASPAGRTFALGGTHATGGRSKIATVVPVQVGGSKTIQVVSVHFSCSWEAQLNLARLIREYLPCNQSIVLGGDFNVEFAKADSLAS